MDQVDGAVTGEVIGAVVGAVVGAVIGGVIVTVIGDVIVTVIGMVGEARVSSAAAAATRLRPSLGCRGVQAT